jgi:putative endonuclease
MPESTYAVYILTDDENTLLYTGMTSNLPRRVREHRAGRGSVFTTKYHVTRLVYFEACADIRAAMAREKQIKAGSRQKKLDLVNGMNPEWKDLAEEMGLVSS